MLRKFRVFNLKKRVMKVLRRSPPEAEYRRLDPPPARKARPISRLFGCVRAKAKALWSTMSGRVNELDLVHVGEGTGEEKVVAVPKGQMAVYVGHKDGEFRRVLVPVIYINHPRFGDLLREAEEEFGFSHPGGITIPCRISDFERVQTRIAAGRGGRKLMTWKNSHQS